MDNFIDGGRLSVIYNNFYFDSDDYDDPIKRFIDDKLWVNLMAYRMKETDVFVRQNHLELQDSYLQFMGEEEKSFISIPNARETIDDIWSDEPKVAGFFFRVDSIDNTYQRQVYSSGDLFAQIGGIFIFFKLIGGFIVIMFSERLLVSALASKLYQVYDDKKDQDNQENSFDRSHQNKSSNKIVDISMVSAVDEESQFFHKNPLRRMFKNTLY